MVIVCKSKKLLDLLHCGGHRPISITNLHLSWICLDAVPGEDMPQKFNLMLEELAFGRFKLQACLLEAGEDHL